MHWFDQTVEAGCTPESWRQDILRFDLWFVLKARRVKKLKRAEDSLLTWWAYNMLTGLFCDKNKADEVYEMLTDIKGAGVKPDSITYNTLISSFGKLKDFERVRS